MAKTVQNQIAVSKFKDMTRYTLPWSPYYKMDRFVINNHIPAEAGIYQIFIKRLNHLEELLTERAYYGGLRGTLREVMDPLSPREFPYKEQIMEGPCFCRFVICPHQNVLDRVMKYLNGTAGDAVKYEVTEKDSNGLVLQF